MFLQFGVFKFEWERHFPCSAVDGPLGCFCLLREVNDAAVNHRVQVLSGYLFSVLVGVRLVALYSCALHFCIFPPPTPQVY